MPKNRANLINIILIGNILFTADRKREKERKFLNLNKSVHGELEIYLTRKVRYNEYSDAGVFTLSRVQEIFGLHLLLLGFQFR